MAEPKPDNGHPLAATPSTRLRSPAWIVEWECARERFLEDQMRSLEQVARRCLPICHINPSIEVHVEHLTVNYRSDGTATKHAFKVTVQDKQYHFSVKKNAGNGHDILTQIAAMECVRRSTDVFQVPNVIAYDASDDNELGGSWIAREYIPGERLCDRWSALSMEQKQSITRDLARYLAQLYHIRFDKIGSLVYDSNGTTLRESPTKSNSWFDWWCALWLWFTWSCCAIVNLVTSSPQRHRTTPPLLGNNIVVGKDWSITYPGLAIGPFNNARDWLSSRLQQTIRNNWILAEDVGNGYGIDDEYSRIISESIRWTEYLRQRPSVGRRERFTTLYHHIRESSVIISDDGQLAGLLNWDRISVCPTWASTAIPDALVSSDSEMLMTFEEFIESQSSQMVLPPADHAAILEAYAESTTHLAMTGSSVHDPSQWPHQHYPYRISDYIRLYWKQLETYEKTRMRDVFLSTMGDLAPDWVTVHSRRKMDTAIAMRVRDLVNGSVRYLSHFKEEFQYAQPDWPDNLSEASWPSDEDTVYDHDNAGSDVDDDR